MSQAFDYIRMQKTALRLIKKFGGQMTLTGQDSSTYDIESNENVVIPATSVAVFGVIVDHKADEIDGTMVLDGDKKLLLSAKNTTIPKLNDTIVYAGGEWTLQNPITEVNPASTRVIYKCNIRP